jgi:NAD(P)-dependent dehydrogenase (short-subunit alcohol dehydrogenase family)
MGITFDFEGHAASGMGLHTARAFVGAGAAVTLADVSEDALQQAVDEIKAAGGSAIGVLCDVADEAQVAVMVERIAAELGRLDATFNNAGIQVPSSDVQSISMTIRPARTISTS